MHAGFYVINTSQRIRGVLLSAASNDARAICVTRCAALCVRPPADTSYVGRVTVCVDDVVYEMRRSLLSNDTKFVSFQLVSFAS